MARVFTNSPVYHRTGAGTGAFSLLRYATPSPTNAQRVPGFCRHCLTKKSRWKFQGTERTGCNGRVNASLSSPAGKGEQILEWVILNQRQQNLLDIRILIDLFIRYQLPKKLQFVNQPADISGFFIAPAYIIGDIRTP